MSQFISLRFQHRPCTFRMCIMGSSPLTYFSVTGDVMVSINLVIVWPENSPFASPHISDASFKWLICMAHLSGHVHDKNWKYFNISITSSSNQCDVNLFMLPRSEGCGWIGSPSLMQLVLGNGFVLANDSCDTFFKCNGEGMIYDWNKCEPWILDLNSCSGE